MKNRKSALCIALVMVLLATNSICAQAAVTPADTTVIYADSDEKIAINKTNFKDLTAFAKKQDTDGDGYLSKMELLNVGMIQNDTDNDGKVDIKINGLDGIEKFPNVGVVSLTKYSNSELKIPESSSVKWLKLEDINTTSLKIDAPSVKYIGLYSRSLPSNLKLKKIDISTCSELVEFSNSYGSGEVTKLKLPKEKSNLRSIMLYGMKCSSLNLTEYKNLQQVDVLCSSMKSINLSKNKELLYVYFYNCKNLKTVKVNKASKLRYLNWYGCSSLKKSGVKTAGKGKIAGGTGSYWLQTKKYQEFYNTISDLIWD